MKIPFDVNLSGKTAIVTGGSGTLCSAMAYGLAVSGASVALIGRNHEKMSKVVSSLTQQALGEHGKSVTIKGYICNVTDKSSLISAYETIRTELGSCDILINGAGGNQPGSITAAEMLAKEPGADDYSFWDLDEDKIREVMDLNFMGTLLPIQVFTRDMVAKRSGSIINIASVSSILPLTKVVTYSNAKCAILNLTQWLATHFGQSGIRCNAIAPVSTPPSRITIFYSTVTAHLRQGQKRLLQARQWADSAIPKSLSVLLCFLQVMMPQAL